MESRLRKALNERRLRSIEEMERVDLAKKMSETLVGRVDDGLASAIDRLEQRLGEIEARLDKADADQRVKMRELERAVGAIEVNPVVNVPGQAAPDLSPILDAIGSIPVSQGVDLAPILSAIKAMQRPTKWTLMHHRDFRGNIIETEAIAE